LYIEDSTIPSGLACRVEFQNAANLGREELCRIWGSGRKSMRNMRSLVEEQKVNIRKGGEKVKFSGHAFDQGGMKRGRKVERRLLEI
jgi:hypothetical protein